MAESQAGAASPTASRAAISSQRFAALMCCPYRVLRDAGGDGAQALPAHLALHLRTDVVASMKDAATHPGYKYMQ